MIKKVTLYHTINPTCATIIYPSNKTMQIDSQLIFPRHYDLGHVLLDTDPLNEMDSWKEVVRLFKKPRIVDPGRLNPIQTVRKTTSNKKLQQKNKKFRNVTIQITEDRNNKNKESKNNNAPDHIKPRSEYTQQSYQYNICPSRIKKCGLRFNTTTYD